MTTQEYLSMPDELHKKIVSDVRKLESYKDLASSISSPQFGEKAAAYFVPFPIAQKKSAVTFASSISEAFSLRPL